ncbi:hypothetical protein ACWIG5_20715 [Streptomyces lydicus]
MNQVSDVAPPLSYARLCAPPKESYEPAPSPGPWQGGQRKVHHTGPDEYDNKVGPYCNYFKAGLYQPAGPPACASPTGQRPESGPPRGADDAWPPGRETQPAVAASVRRTAAPANTAEETGHPTHRVRSPRRSGSTSTVTRMYLLCNLVTLVDRGAETSGPRRNAAR